MFCKLRMTVKEVIDEFRIICIKVYIPNLSASERTRNLRECIEDLLKRKGLPEDLKLGKDTRVTDDACPWYAVR